MLFTANARANAGTDIFLTSGARTSTSGISNLLSIGTTVQPTSGTGVFNQMLCEFTINQTGGANGITRGLYLNPTLTSAADWRSIEWSNNTGFGLYGIGGATNYLSGSLGIGTTTPSASLDVSGSTRVQGTLTVGNNVDSTILVNSAAASGFRTMIFKSAGSNESTIFDVRPTGTSNNMTGIYLRDSETGVIGTNSMIIGRGNATFPSTGVSYIGNIVNFNATADSFHIGFLVSNTTAGRFEALRVSNSGNIGIGTITPSASLHISGAASSTLLLVSSSAATALFVSGSGNVGLGTNTPGQLLTVLGNAQFGFSSTSAGARLHTRGAGVTSTSTSFRAENNSQLPALRITDDLSARFDGKVGIGSGNFPTASLDVAGTTRLSGSFNTAISGSILTVQGSGSAQPIFTVQGSQGELFSITDSLSGSLFSVNDISGLPILEVFSDNTTLIGNYQDPMLITTAKVVQTNSGSFTVYSLPTASYDTAFFEYSIRSGSNARAGTIMAMQLGSTVNFTETTTTDFGSTSAVSFTVIVTGSNMALTGSSTTGSWTIKTIVRGL
jgi:hypothetical protein